MIDGRQILTRDSQEHAKVDDARNASSRRSEADNESTADAAHEKEDEWRPLAGSIGEPGRQYGDSGRGDVDRDLEAVSYC